MLNSHSLLSESLPRPVSLSVNGYDSSGVPLFGQCNCRRGRRGTSSPVSVASSVHSEGLPPGFLCNRRQTSEVRIPPNSYLSMCSQSSLAQISASYYLRRDLNTQSARLTGRVDAHCSTTSYRTMVRHWFLNALRWVYAVIFWLAIRRLLTTNYVGRLTRN